MKLHNLKKRFENIDNLQADYNSIHYDMQNEHYGIFSCSSTWRSILMWSHYSNYHKGYCIGFNTKEIIKHYGKIGKVLYRTKYPEIKPKITRNDPDYMFKSFTETHTKAYPWRYEHEYRFMKTIFPDKFTSETRKVKIEESCFSEVILGIESSTETKQEIIRI